MATRKEIRDYFAKFGKEGGKTRARNMTAEQRREAARKASEARWAKNDERIAVALKEMNEETKALLGKTARARGKKKRDGQKKSHKP